MAIIVIIFLVLLFIVLGYLVFRIIKWTLKNKTRRLWGASIAGVVILVSLVDTFFFKKMEFIQSKVYPNVYLVKNPLEDKDSLNSAIKKMSLRQWSDSSNNNTVKGDLSIRFYEYYKTWGIIPFGEAGTAHFIENKESPDGFSNELLQHYNNHKIAEFNSRPCINDTLNFFGNLTYYTHGIRIHTELILNGCLNSE